MTPFVLAQTVLPGTPTDIVPSAWKMTAAFLVVLALLAVLAWMMRRLWSARRASGSMHVETALSLGERRSLVVVTVEGRRLLVGLAPNHVSLVTELGARPFDQALSAAVGKEPRA